jgi:hypothetical protein
MKTIIFSLTLGALSILSACSNTTPTNKETVKSIANTLTVKDLEGSWVNAEYLDALTETRSPRQSAEKMGQIALLNFKADALKGDSLIGELSYNGHEGGQYCVVFKAGKAPNSVQFGEYSPDNTATPSDLTLENGILTIAHHDPNEVQPQGRVRPPYKFRRFSPTVQSLDEGNSIAVIQTLFTGDWTMTDKTGKKTPIKIDNLGKMTGNPDYVQLSVLTDYTGEDLPHDQVYIFDGASKRPEILHFKHEGKKITFTTTGEKEKERLEFTWTK